MTRMPSGKRCCRGIFCLRIKMLPTYFMAPSYLTMYVLSCNLLAVSRGAPCGETEGCYSQMSSHIKEEIM